ncbi:MAG TPA: RNA polymerase subunit sigma-70, partial [Actinobacteria bacterium]|nr:RNA polymerase subunit sigma-70 [Actinomycetota bacterium]
LGIPVGTVRSRIHCARVQLRELLPEAAQRTVEEDEL